jgi:hypothetical protein
MRVQAGDSAYPGDSKLRKRMLRSVPTAGCVWICRPKSPNTIAPNSLSLLLRIQGGQEFKFRPGDPLS